MRLKRSFFEKPTLWVSRNLLGKRLVRKVGSKKLVGIITETEAYCGTADKACHSAKGRTARTEAMFGPAGHAYVYFIYGMHWCFNVVTRKIGEPEAVLIRGVTLPDGTLISGPAKVAKYFKIDKALYSENLVKSKKLWFETSTYKVKPNHILRTPRIGVAYAGEYAAKPWRFILKSPRGESNPRPSP